MFKEYKSIPKVAPADMVPGADYITVGLDMDCFPAVCTTTFLRVENGDEYIFSSGGIKFRCMRLTKEFYEFSPANLRKARQEILDYCIENFPFRFQPNIKK